MGQLAYTPGAPPLSSVLGIGNAASAGQQILADAGTAALPGLAFNGDPNNGIFSPGADRWAVATGGGARWEITAAGHLLASVANAFDVGPVLGVIFRAADATGGRLEMDGGALRVLRGDAGTLIASRASEFQANDGAAATPSYRFTSDAGGTGMFTPGPSRIAFATAGAARWEVSAAGHLIGGLDATYDVGAAGATRPRSVYAATSFLSGLGAAATPSHSFDGDTNTGMFSPAADTVGFATAGAERWRINASGHTEYFTDNALDVGLNGSNRPRSVFARTSVVVQTVVSPITISDGSISATAGALTVGTAGLFALALRTNGSDRLTISSAGLFTIADALDVAVGTVTGTKIGTATTQKLGFWNGTPQTRQSSAALTNNVTAGGVNDTIADFADLVVFANSAAAIRDDIYQLARKVKEIGDALRLIGILG